MMLLMIVYLKGNYWKIIDSIIDSVVKSGNTVQCFMTQNFFKNRLNHWKNIKTLQLTF